MVMGTRLHSRTNMADNDWNFKIAGREEFKCSWYKQMINRGDGGHSSLIACTCMSYRYLQLLCVD
jgi:hypothetical protein